MATDTAPVETDTLEYAHAGMPRTANWWSAFVIGLAGTILVTGIAPTMVTSLGAAAIPVTFVITVCGWLLCLFLAELAAMMPERTGGVPSYVYPAYKDRWPRAAKHLGAFGAWAYWLGWFPVAPLNMILASDYLVSLFGLNSTAGINLLGTSISWWTIGFSVIGLLALFVPSYLGLKFGTGFATVLAVFAMIPLTFLSISWIFKPSAAHFSELSGFHHLDGSSFFAGQFGHGWLTLYIAFAFLLTWNVIAMEAAACYIGECKDPRRDAKIAMNLEGGYGLFIYTMIPIAFVIVIGAHALGKTSSDPKTIFVTFCSKLFGSGSGADVLNWLVGLMLVVALVLSALNAITGTARSLHQMSTDGNFPLFFSKLNRHGVPSGGMLFTIVCAIAVVFMGGAVQIYTFSNVGYLIAMVPTLFGYFLLRQTRPNLPRPVRLPEFMKWVALGLAVFFLVIYFWGGPVYASGKFSQAGESTLPYYFMGIGVLLLYLPFYWYRHAIEDKRQPPVSDTVGAAGISGTGGEG